MSPGLITGILRYCDNWTISYRNKHSPCLIVLLTDTEHILTWWLKSLKECNQLMWNLIVCNHPNVAYQINSYTIMAEDYPGTFIFRPSCSHICWLLYTWQHLLVLINYTCQANCLTIIMLLCLPPGDSDSAYLPFALTLVQLHLLRGTLPRWPLPKSFHLNDRRWV